MLNKIIIVGRLTSDPQIKQVGSKEEPKEIATFGLAINQGKDDYVEFIDVVVDSYMTESVQKYLQKGDKVVTIGRFANRSYVAKDGTKRVSPSIYAESFEFVDVFAFNTPKIEEKEEPKPEPKSDKPRRK